MYSEYNFYLHNNLSLIFIIILLHHYLDSSECLHSWEKLCLSKHYFQFSLLKQRTVQTQSQTTQQLTLTTGLRFKSDVGLLTNLLI